MWPRFATIAIVFRRTPTNAIRRPGWLRLTQSAARSIPNAATKSGKPQRVDELAAPDQEVLGPESEDDREKQDADPAQPDRREVAERATRQQAEDEARDDAGDQHGTRVTVGAAGARSSASNDACRQGAASGRWREVTMSRVTGGRRGIGRVPG